MRDSTTYRAILEEGRKEGRVEALQKVLLRQGQKRFGRATKSVKSNLQAISEITRLERMTEQLLVVNNWQELLETA